ncbi:hypothetical protein F3Y22_tig00110429pilonHSYRG00147 [Hibiscus syriacus]|uniref:Uncharacterized protein n=1 Tax=Hibiscus syriacus TaxID=106335 RepID=A0A6A3AKV3_HIBSY|nr:hypothetical protein F3Y22_tig00110429pilonHSYRG00147 [Hibiscus syriacus]
MKSFSLVFDCLDRFGAVGSLSVHKVLKLWGKFETLRKSRKTTASRIFTAALTCQSVEVDKPCDQCRECILFFSGRSKDVKEVDSLKINRTDRLRSFVKNAIAPPVSSRFKIFIINECQLLHGCLNFIAAKSSGSLRDAEMTLDHLSLLGKRITVSLTYELGHIGTVSVEELLDLLDLALSCETSNTITSTKMISSSDQEENKLALSITGVSSFKNPLCFNESYDFYGSNSDNRLK